MRKRMGNGVRALCLFFWAPWKLWPETEKVGGGIYFLRILRLLFFFSLVSVFLAENQSFVYQGF